MGAAIVVEGLKKRFGAFWAVRGIDLAYALEERGAPQKIILLTGYPLGQEETPLPANIAGWVIKPPSLGHLSEAIQGALQ